MRAHGKRSRCDVQFGAEADLIVVQGSGCLDRDVHREPMLLAQDEHLPNRERLNPRRGKTQDQRNR